MKKVLYILLLFAFTISAKAQYTTTTSEDGFTQTTTFNPNAARDSMKVQHKKIPKGLNVWTIDEHFGDRTESVRDTTQYLFMNSFYDSGKYGEYNTTGNAGSPRISRIATNNDYAPKFGLLEPYSYFRTKPSELLFTNTLSPITNLTYGACGGSQDGEDLLRVLFATNVNKRLGLGFKFNYIYGRGYYANQNISLFDYTFWTSYIGQRYQSHFIMSFDHMKNTESGGITNDDYIMHPEKESTTYSSSEIPTVLSNNYNKNNAFSAIYSHRYNIGFYHKVPMTEQEKEAKRFALKSKEENKDKEKQDLKNTEGGRRNSEHAQDNKASKDFAGRPDDAKIMGDLPTSKKALEDSKARAMADSLMARNNEKNDTDWTKREYVPVTSFIHTISLDTDAREYLSNKTPSGLYKNRYNVPYEGAPGDSICDKLNYLDLRNTFAIGLLEGFNKYIPMGAKVFVAHEMRHFKLPCDANSYESYNETNVSLGGQLIKTTGEKIHYKAQGEFWLVGKDVGNIKLDGEGELNMRILKDTAQVKLRAFYHLTNPSFLMRHYHSKFFWWDDDDMSKQMQTHLEASFHLARTRTTLRASYDNFQNLTYLGLSYDINSSSPYARTNYTASPQQAGNNISLITIALEQNFRYGILNWENRLTYQKSTDEIVLPVPALNYWTNLYLNFKIARVLSVHFGADMRYYTKYYAPEYCPQLGQYAIQQNDDIRTEVGSHPIIDVYANFKLKQCRFFVMMSHVNAGSGNKGYFDTPHYPLNDSVFRFGLSWDFFN